MIVAAVPVKDLVNAKQRLVPVLSPDERRSLARAMLHDVLAALTPSGLDAVWVVSRDPDVAAIAADHGATIVTETDNLGHTAAVALAQDRASRAGASVFLTVPGDVPCVSPEEILALARAADTVPAAAFTPSRSGLGTNGVALAPPDLLSLRFGEPSFEQHLATARGRGVQPLVLRLRGLGLDIDDADDLRALLVEGPRTASGRLLERLGMAARLTTASMPLAP